MRMKKISNCLSPQLMFCQVSTTKRSRDKETEGSGNSVTEVVDHAAKVEKEEQERRLRNGNKVNRKMNWI
jgi:hypothetical protein